MIVRRLALLLALMLAAPAWAINPKAEPEVNHLLDFVAKSGCTFYRNGSAYDSQAARTHLADKYGQIKDRLKTAEDFIEYAASRSSMTGQNYEVTCGKQPRRSSGDWLREELTRFRGAKPAGGA